jgi:hypothetical protein
MKTRAVFFLLVGLLMSAVSHAADQPDIVVIIADDLGGYDVSWRSPEIKTPNLDKLAASGAKLDQFYVQPLCSPTRAALMTGRYPMRYGLQVGVVRPWADYGLPLEEQLLPQGLKAAGYTTAICGKWHLGSFDKAYWPNARGFDHSYGHLFGAMDYFTHVRDGKPDWYRDGKELKKNIKNRTPVSPSRVGLMRACWPPWMRPSGKSSARWRKRAGARMRLFSFPATTAGRRRVA